MNLDNARMVQTQKSNDNKGQSRHILWIQKQRGLQTMQNGGSRITSPSEKIVLVCSEHSKSLGLYSTEIYVIWSILKSFDLSKSWIILSNTQKILKIWLQNKINSSLPTPFMTSQICVILTKFISRTTCWHYRNIDL